MGNMANQVQKQIMPRQSNTYVVHKVSVNNKADK